jgi:nucleotide-binding universal stress UspA family protein
MSTSSRPIDAGAEPLPTLADGRPAREVVVALTGELWNDRGAAVGGRYAAHWKLPLRIVHLAAGDSDEKAEANARWAAANMVPSPVVEVQQAGDDAAGAIVAAVGQGALLVLSTDAARDPALVATALGEQVLRAVAGPIVLCGPSLVSIEPSGSVIVGLDGSQEAEGAIGPAVDLARSLRSTLWLVTVVDSATTAQVAKLRAEGHKVSESGHLREKAGELVAGGVQAGWQILHGDDAASALTSFARDRGAAMLAVWGSGAGETEVLSGVSRDLVLSSSVPVLVGRDGR